MSKRASYNKRPKTSSISYNQDKYYRRSSGFQGNSSTVRRTLILPDRFDTKTVWQSECSRLSGKHKQWEYSRQMTNPRQLIDFSGGQMNLLPIGCLALWSIEDVGEWVSNTLGFPQYKEAFVKNYISGDRLCFVNASVLTQMNIHDFDHIKFITEKIRNQFGIKGKEEYVWKLDKFEDDPLLLYYKVRSYRGKTEGKHKFLETWRALGIIGPERKVPCQWFKIETSSNDPKIFVPRKFVWKDKLCVPNPKYVHLGIHSPG